MHACSGLTLPIPSSAAAMVVVGTAIGRGSGGLRPLGGLAIPSPRSSGLGGLAAAAKHCSRRQLDFTSCTWPQLCCNARRAGACSLRWLRAERAARRVAAPGRDGSAAACRESGWVRGRGPPPARGKRRPRWEGGGRGPDLAFAHHGKVVGHLAAGGRGGLTVTRSVLL